MAKSKVTKVVGDNLGKNNPVFIQILGICSTLAVTNVFNNTLVMSAGLIFTTALSGLTISLFRNLIPSRIRMIVETMVIAGYVILVDLGIKAFYPDISRDLGPYVGLIITNCIIMGRAEAFSMSNKPFISLIDGITSGIGYAYVLLAISLVRELMGSGTLNIIDLVKIDITSWWTNWSIMVMAPGAFFVLAVFIWIVKGKFFQEEKKGGGA